MKGIDLSNHYFTTSSSDVNEIMSRVLASLNLNFFRYLKLYRDGSRLHLCNNSDWTNYFYQEGQYSIAWYDRSITSHAQSYRTIWDEKRLFNGNIVGVHARNIFNIHHGISIVRPHMDSFELFDFATTAEKVSINEMYMRSPEILDEVIFYFKELARNLILEAEKNKIQLPFDMSVETIKQNESVVQSSLINKFYITTTQGEIYLTKREFDCLSLWLCSKTSKQIGQFLEMSYRTVETHLEHIKEKFNVRCKDKLFGQLQDIGLFEVMIKNGLRLFRESNPISNY